MSAIDPIKLARYIRLARVVKQQQKMTTNNNNNNNNEKKKEGEEEEEQKQQKQQQSIREAKRKYWRMQGAVSALR